MLLSIKWKIRKELLKWAPWEGRIQGKDIEG
jgi:hypothetical protein